ncbi:uncharacterized protein LOC143433321 [Xylocopa sonorina]|uniref:uncharacterized protein LOC143433321 n=1 Tax=Xylocopa sonorina TaxID=1818115 RepID=UPI00403AF145
MNGESARTTPLRHFTEFYRILLFQKVLDLWRWLLLAGFFGCSSSENATAFECQRHRPPLLNLVRFFSWCSLFLFAGLTASKPRLFSPRMDYDEWTPLGRGDPLKNNPTFDYVPPVLDRVQYWLDSHTTEPSAKRDVLVLGVTAKKTSPKIPEQFLKFVDGPKFTRSSNHQDLSYRNDFTGSTGAEPPKVVRTSNFRIGPIDYRNQNRIQSMPASYYPSPYRNGQKTKPYTMMLPPPFTRKEKPTVNGGFVNTQTEEGPVLRESSFLAKPPPPPPPPPPSSYLVKQQPQTVSQVETIKSVYAVSSPQPTRPKYETITTPSVSFEKSNLIYQSTQTLAGGWPPGGNSNGAVVAVAVPLSTPTANDPGQQTLDRSRDHYEIDHQPAASSNHEVVVEQNANIIVDGDSNENEEVVVGQKGVDSIATTTVVTTFLDEEREKMHIVVANAPATDPRLYPVTDDATKKPSVAVVVPINYSEKKTNESGSATEAASKLQHHQQPPLSSLMHRPQPRPDHRGTMHFLGSMHPSLGFRAPASMPMFRVHAHGPPVGSQSGPHRFVNSATPSTTTTTTTMIGPDDRFLDDQHRSRVPNTTVSIFTTPTAATFLPTVVSSVAAETENLEDASSRITTVPSLTTDPIFSHYNQPAKPIRGPMYLIIQGHSKVKTYKPTVTKHGVPVERNEILEGITENHQLSKFQQFVQESTRGNRRVNAPVAIPKNNNKEAEAAELAKTRPNDLMSLVESGLPNFTVSPTTTPPPPHPPPPPPPPLPLPITEDGRPANSIATTIEISGN